MTETNTKPAVLDETETPVRVIDREGMKRLDAEIEARKLAKAENRSEIKKAEPTTYADLLDGVEDPGLQRALAILGARIITKPAPEPEPPKAAPAPKTARVIQLPIWPEPVRGAPNSFLRSALFAAIQGKERRPLKEEFLGSTQGVAVRFTGWQLDQSDLDVWEQAVHLARLHPLGNVCHFTANAFLKALGRSNGKKDYLWLHSAFTRLVACAVEIRCGTIVFTGSLLSSCVRDEATGVYKLTLDPDTIKLYGGADWSSIEWEQRQALKGKPLALWLHGFYSSHAEPHAYKVETLRRLCGSANKEARGFKRQLKRAFADTEAAAGLTGTIDGDLVNVARLPSPTQARHIISKATGRQQKKRP